MNRQVADQKSPNPKGKKKLKFKGLSSFWKGMVIGLTLTTLAAAGAAIGFFMVNIYPLSFQAEADIKEWLIQIHF